MGAIVEAPRNTAVRGETLRLMAYYVQQLWRYPVKSLAGESMERAEVLADGIAGDRLVVVHGPNGVLTSRTRPGLLSLHATLSPDGEPLIAHVPAGSDMAAALVRMVAGPEAELALLDTAERFDVLPLLVATDGAIKAFGRDGRRLRPNIVLGGVDGLAEREWEGARLRIGQVVIRLDSLRARCVMTTFHPDTLFQDVEVLNDINARFDGKLALNAAVEVPGAIALGDPAQIAFT
ncbi:MAG TPA: MOSC N-terminal beta barrel domain-containing protein [Solirubrobacteraceae bacterium]|nr:MOSC N-terminal beta barrel domain-containing protein [Solirubrobacteraceae bacterium]